jgi:hypothetical protein
MPSLPLLKARAEALTEWIADNGDGCAEKQRHLDTDTRERVYWHYGYLIALRDVIAYLDGSEDKFH